MPPSGTVVNAFARRRTSFKVLFIISLYGSIKCGRQTRKTMWSRLMTGAERGRKRLHSDRMTAGSRTNLAENATDS